MKANSNSLPDQFSLTNSFGAWKKYVNNLNVHFQEEWNGNDPETAVDFGLLETAFMHRLYIFIVARRQCRWRRPESE